MKKTKTIKKNKPHKRMINKIEEMICCAAAMYYLLNGVEEMNKVLGLEQYGLYGPKKSNSTKLKLYFTATTPTIFCGERFAPF
jgi:hypothetical protein